MAKPSLGSVGLDTIAELTKFCGETDCSTSTGVSYAVAVRRKLIKKLLQFSVFELETLLAACTGLWLPNGMGKGTQGGIMRRLVSFATIIVLLGLCLVGREATGQPQSLKEQLVGTWILVAWEQTGADGGKFQKYGPDPRGFHIFERNGRFFAMMARPDLPKIAASDPQYATPEEARAIMAGSIAYYGTYTVNEPERMFILRMEATTFPNQLGRDLPRRIVSVTANEMVYANPSATTGGGQIMLSWKRAQ